MTPSGSKKARTTKAVRGTDAGGKHDARDHGHVEIRLSKATSGAVDAALRGLTKAQREKVRDAIARVGAEAGDKGARFVEKNVIANASELLAFMTPALAAARRWSELRAIWTFLAYLDVPIDHEKLARRLEKDHGEDLADRYRKAAGERREI
jgi:hypothetical protein